MSKVKTISLIIDVLIIRTNCKINFNLEGTYDNLQSEPSSPAMQISGKLSFFKKAEYFSNRTNHKKISRETDEMYFWTSTNCLVTLNFLLGNSLSAASWKDFTSNKKQSSVRAFIAI